MSLSVLIAEPSPAYTLRDSGGGRKLEDWHGVRLVRPEPQAMWPPSAPAEWANAAAVFEPAGEDEERGRWRGDTAEFTVAVAAARMIVRLAGNHHTGLFPEQAPHWTAAAEAVRGHEGAEVLNLFGYTGAASLLLAAAGARVTHVDASRKAIAWARENQAASGLDDAPIRWICDDARKFAAREVRRGRRYHAILLDPPKFGRGPKGETWNLFDDLAPLMADVAALLADDARIMTLTAYALRASPLAFGRLAEHALAGRAGRLEVGELALREVTGRLLPTSMFVTWRPQ